MSGRPRESASARMAARAASAFAASPFLRSISAAASFARNWVNTKPCALASWSAVSNVAEAGAALPENASTRAASIRNADRTEGFSSAFADARTLSIGFQRFRSFALVQQGMREIANGRDLLVLGIGFVKFVARQKEELFGLRRAGLPQCSVEPWIHGSPRCPVDRRVASRIDRASWKRERASEKFACSRRISPKVFMASLTLARSPLARANESACCSCASAFFRSPC